MEDIIKKIQKMSLTRTDAKVAEYICDHVDTIGLQTSTSISEIIGVSDTSIIRFIRKLGFKGYAEFRSEMSKRMERQYDQAKIDLSPGEKYANSKERLKRDSLILDVSTYTLDNLGKSYSKLNNETIEQITDIILNSDRKYIAGFRGTMCCANYMASKLLFLTPHVISITHADATAVEKIIDSTEKDCLLVYSFPHYSEINHTIMEIAHQNKAKIVLITDRPTSSLANKADVVVCAYVDGLGFTNSYVAPLSISELILLAISGKSDVNRSSRFDRIDKVIERKKLY